MSDRPGKKKRIIALFRNTIEEAWSWFPEYIISRMGFGSESRWGGNYSQSSKNLSNGIDSFFEVPNVYIRVSALYLRFFILGLLVVVYTINISNSLYSLEESFHILVMMFSYGVSLYLLVSYYTMYSDKLQDNPIIEGFISFVEVSIVYAALWFWPTGREAVLVGYFKNFLFVVITLSLFSLQIRVSIFTCLYTSLLNYFLGYTYYIDFLSKYSNSEILIAIPDNYVLLNSIYYTVYGIILILPIHFLKKFHNSGIREVAFNFIINPHRNFSLIEVDTIISGEYSIIKLMRNYEDNHIGSDYSALKEYNDNGKVLATLLVGDTVGHGITRSMGSVITMGVFHAMYTKDPKFIIESINRVLVRLDKDSGGKSLATVLNLEKNGRITYCGNAGILKHSKERLPLQVNSKMLGIDSPIELKNNRLRLNKGESVTVETDGAYFSDTDDQTVIIVKRIDKWG